MNTRLWFQPVIRTPSSFFRNFSGGYYTFPVFQSKAKHLSLRNMERRGDTEQQLISTHLSHMQLEAQRVNIQPGVYYIKNVTGNSYRNI